MIKLVPIFLLVLVLGCGPTSGIVTSKDFIPAHSEIVPNISMDMDGGISVDYDEEDYPDRWKVTYKCGEVETYAFVTKDEFEKLNVGDIYGTTVEK